MSFDWLGYIRLAEQLSDELDESSQGKPRIRNTRIPVSLILGYLAAGNTVDKIIEEFPDLKYDDMLACIDYAMFHPVE